MATAVATMGGSTKGRTVGRKRKQEPPRDTPTGVLMHWLAALIERSNLTVDDIADQLDVDRTTVFRWLSGRTSPTVEQLDRMAMMLGKADLWALRPPKRFTDGL